MVQLTLDDDGALGLFWDKKKCDFLLLTWVEVHECYKVWFHWKKLPIYG